MKFSVCCKLLYLLHPNFFAIKLVISHNKEALESGLKHALFTLCFTVARPSLNMTSTFHIDKKVKSKCWKYWSDSKWDGKHTDQPDFLCRHLGRAVCWANCPEWICPWVIGKPPSARLSWLWGRHRDSSVAWSTPKWRRLQMWATLVKRYQRFKKNSRQVRVLHIWK